MIEQKSIVGIYSGGKDESLILKNLVESFSIIVFEDASLVSVFNPWGVLVGDFNAVKLRVKEVDYIRAKKIVDDYEAGVYNL